MDSSIINPEGMELQPINIFLTETDRFGSNLSKMSNYMDGYVQQLSLMLQRNTTLEAITSAPISDLGIISDVVQLASIVHKGNVMLIPDFDNLPPDIKTKLKKKIYSIGESRQVDGNLRAVILDENGQRIKDITLKKVPINPGTLETARRIQDQLQMRQIYAKLADIHEFQQFQLEKDRDRDIFIPFLTARGLVLEAETKNSIEERNRLLIEADAEMRKAINAISADIKTTSIRFAKIAGRPYNNLSSQIDTYMSFLVRDLQALNQYVGIRMQILTYLGQNQTAQLVMNQYQHTLHDFLVDPINKKGLSAADLLHNFFPYTEENMNCWYYYAEEMRPMIESSINTLRLDNLRSSAGEIYVVNLEDIEDGE